MILQTQITGSSVATVIPVITDVGVGRRLTEAECSAAFSLVNEDTNAVILGDVDGTPLYLVTRTYPNQQVTYHYERMTKV